jgi:hypothetical protein
VRGFEKLMDDMGALVEDTHEAVVSNLKAMGCPPEFVLLYDAIPCTTSHALAWTAIREEQRKKGVKP